MQSLLIGLGISASIAIVSGILLKKFPKEKCAAWSIGIAENLFKIMNVFLNAKAGEENAHKIEEGIVYTVAYSIAAFGNRMCDLCQKHVDAMKNAN